MEIFLGAELTKPAIHDDLAVIDGLKAGHAAQGRALTAPGRPQQRDHLAFSDRERHIIHGTGFAEILRDPIDDQVPLRILFHQTLIPSLPVKCKKTNAAPKSRATWIMLNAAIAPTGEST